MTQQRKSISKKIRFEIFKRDSFTCQYCGESAPKVILEVDHIKPVINGGTNDILNLITSCFDCNRGKSKRELDDNSMVSKQHNQAKLLQERTSQIEMMAEWQLSLINEDNLLVNKFNEFWDKLTNSTLTDSGRKTIKKHIHEFGYQKICEFAIKAHDKYSDDNSKAFNSIRKLIVAESMPEKLKQTYYLRGVLKNRFGLSQYNNYVAFNLLRDLLNIYTYDSIYRMCCDVRNWSDFQNRANNWLEEDEE